MCDAEERPQDTHGIVPASETRQTRACVCVCEASQGANETGEIRDRSWEERGGSYARLGVALHQSQERGFRHKDAKVEVP